MRTWFAVGCTVVLLWMMVPTSPAFAQAAVEAHSQPAQPQVPCSAPSSLPAQSDASVTASGLVTVHPQDNGSAPINPGMGWVMHYYDNGLFCYGPDLAPEDTLDYFPGMSVVYLRLPWCYIEPREGEFDWSVVDGPAQRFIAAGKRVAFRFTCTEGHHGISYGSPQWLREKGAKGVEFFRGEDVPSWEPTYDDPVFLEYLGRFLDQVARRYDNDPNVAFIDVGSYGSWGEGHTWGSTKLPSSPELVQTHLQIHQERFHKVLLAINDDLLVSGYKGKDRQLMLDCAAAWAAKGNFTLRDDSIMVNPGDRAYRSADLAQPFWPLRPVILECAQLHPFKEKGSWGDGSKYIEAMELYHASYASAHDAPDVFYRECRDLVDRMNRRLGYRLLPVELSWPAQVKAGGRLEIAGRWINEGVAPCYGAGTRPSRSGRRRARSC